MIWYRNSKLPPRDAKSPSELKTATVIWISRNMHLGMPHHNHAPPPHALHSIVVWPAVHATKRHATLHNIREHISRLIPIVKRQEIYRATLRGAETLAKRTG